MADVPNVPQELSIDSISIFSFHSSREKSNHLLLSVSAHLREWEVSCSHFYFTQTRVQMLSVLQWTDGSLCDVNVSWVTGCFQPLHLSSLIVECDCVTKSLDFVWKRDSMAHLLQLHVNALLIPVLIGDDIFTIHHTIINNCVTALCLICVVYCMALMTVWLLILYLWP